MVANILIAIGFFAIGFIAGAIFASMQLTKIAKEELDKHIIVYEI